MVCKQMKIMKTTFLLVTETTFKIEYDNHVTFIHNDSLEENQTSLNTISMNLEHLFIFRKID